MNAFKVINGDTVTIIESDLDFKGFQAITNWNYCVELLGSDLKAVKIGFGLKNPIDCIKQVKTETKTKTILPTAILFAAIQAKKQGLNINSFVAKNARCFNAAIRSFWLTIKITFSKVLKVKNGVIVHSDFNSFEVGINADLPYLTKWIDRYNRLGVVSVTGLAQLVVL